LRFYRVVATGSYIRYISYYRYLRSRFPASREKKRNKTIPATTAMATVGIAACKAEDCNSRLTQCSEKRTMHELAVPFGKEKLSIQRCPRCHFDANKRRPERKIFRPVRRSSRLFLHSHALSSGLKYPRQRARLATPIVLQDRQDVRIVFAIWLVRQSVLILSRKGSGLNSRKASTTDCCHRYFIEYIGLLHSQCV
jgi:hypothetical protein